MNIINQCYFRARLKYNQLNNNLRKIPMDKFEKSGAWNLPVVDQNNRYLGFVSKSKIFSSYREKLQDVSHD